MKAQQIAVGAVVVITLIAVTAFYTNEIVASNPVIKGHVGRVKLAKATDRVDASIGSKGDVRRLSCTSKSDRNIFCNAIGSGVYRVSFATDVVAPAFELTEQRTTDGKLYVNAFNRVSVEIPAREVDRFISAFDRRVTVQVE